MLLKLNLNRIMVAGLATYVRCENTNSWINMDALNDSVSFNHAVDKYNKAQHAVKQASVVVFHTSTILPLHKF